jgi:hypothetical protein
VVVVESNESVGGKFTIQFQRLLDPVVVVESESVESDAGIEHGLSKKLCMREFG